MDMMSWEERQRNDDESARVSERSFGSHPSSPLPLAVSPKMLNLHIVDFACLFVGILYPTYVD